MKFVHDIVERRGEFILYILYMYGVWGLLYGICSKDSISFLTLGFFSVSLFISMYGHAYLFGCKRLLCPVSISYFLFLRD